MINYYLLSLASADLLCGLLVVPFSVYPALVRRWVYGDIVCRLVGYLEVTLWAVSVYTFMWISVDRYLAIRWASVKQKQERTSASIDPDASRLTRDSVLPGNH